MRACIGLGSNLDDPPAQLQQAVSALARLPDTRVVAVSPLYRNAPLVPAGEDPAGQPDYVNAVAVLDTTMAPLALLDALQAIENDQHRIRTRRWGPRTLDLDLLLYGDERIDLPRLTVPHPGLRERRFVLLPLHDVAPDLVLPDGVKLTDVLVGCPPAELVVVGHLQLP